MVMAAKTNRIEHGQGGPVGAEGKKRPPRTPAPDVQYFIYGPRLPWVDEQKLKGVRPEEDVEDTRG